MYVMYIHINMHIDRRFLTFILKKIEYMIYIFCIFLLPLNIVLLGTLLKLHCGRARAGEWREGSWLVGMSILVTLLELPGYSSAIRQRDFQLGVLITMNNLLLSSR